MREEDIRKLSEPYQQSRDELDRRLHSALGADIPSAGVLVKEIFEDLSTQTFGISWWQSVSVQERILISDYLYQCAEGIEANLVEAKLHFLEWLHVREQQDKRIADVFSVGPSGRLVGNYPPSIAPIDDLPNKFEGLHVCGFFRAIGSTLDCLGGAIIGVLGLKFVLRKNDIAKARQTLGKVKNPQTPGEHLQVAFREFLETQIVLSGPKDWLEWADQYRNMFVHRGRRIYFAELTRREVALFDANDQLIPRWKIKLHLATSPDKSDAEAFVKRDISLNEDAETTLTGMFKSTRELLEAVCERLVSIWRERRNTPALIEQPSTQWNENMRGCDFAGYNQIIKPFSPDMMMGNNVLAKRMLAGAILDHQRSLWLNTPWDA
jgi:hypothetical protein